LPNEESSPSSSDALTAIGANSGLAALPTKRTKKWTQLEDELLEFLWGERSANALAVHLGRSVGAVINRGVKVLKLGPPRRGYLSMAELERRSGYKASTILTAAKRLGISLRRQPVYQTRVKPGCRRSNYGRNWAIDEDSAQAVLAELGKRPDGTRRALSYRGEWGGSKPAACVACGLSSRPHCARGLCGRCYMRSFRSK